VGRLRARRPSLARRLVLSLRALAKRARVTVFVCHDGYAASRGFSGSVQLSGISDALAENASVVFSMAPITSDDTRVYGLERDDDAAQYARLDQKRAFRGAKLSKAFFDLASPSLSAHLPWPWCRRRIHVSRRRRSTVRWRRGWRSRARVGSRLGGDSGRGGRAGGQAGSDEARVRVAEA
jgi:hypothetical protein